MPKLSNLLGRLRADIDEVEKAALTSQGRDDLPDSDFALPGREYPIHDVAHARNALARVAQHGTSEEQGKVRAAVERRYPALAKAGSITNPVAVVLEAEPQSGEFAAVVALHKDEARQLVTGVVLTPGVRDSQDDVIEAADIETAAHRFLTAYRKHDVQHSEHPADIDTVESYIAPVDFEIGGQPVLKGSWVLVSHVRDADAWSRVQKGEITGYSVGGTGERLPEAP